ncbi:MAG: c-type cytochrome [Gammaproteobacteria bacterium]
MLSLLLSIPTAAAVDWPTIELINADKSLWPAETNLAVAEDEVYQQTKKYRGHLLSPLLETVPLPAGLQPHETLVVFTALDGYKVAMSYQDAFTETGLIAIRDLGAPSGKTWTAFEFGGQEITPGPYYLVWAKKGLEKWRYPWPFHLASITLQSPASYYGAAAPQNAGPAAARGFGLFSRHCIRCHSVNGAGGGVGPELNRPISVVAAYRDEELAELILNAPLKRPGTKMPAFDRVLRRAEALQIVDYLKHMSRNNAGPSE